VLFVRNIRGQARFSFKSAIFCFRLEGCRRAIIALDIFLRLWFVAVGCWLQNGGGCQGGFMVCPCF
jgi:hypothetical protein